MSKKEINIKATLIGIRERQERIQKIKANKEKQLQEENNKNAFGVELLYNVMKKQNQKVLEDLNEIYKTKLPSNTDLQTEFIKPPYLTPQIVSHKQTKILNQT
jgi:hypothetical protein